MGPNMLHNACPKKRLSVIHKILMGPQLLIIFAHKSRRLQLSIPVISIEFAGQSPIFFHPFSDPREVFIAMHLLPIAGY